MVNQYTGITEYYDLLMTAGYYDHHSLAKEARSIAGDGRLVIELGVGTGLLAEKYIELDPYCKFTGIDYTPSMLEVAKKRLGNRVKLIEADAVTMNLNATFDVAIANGGVWGFLDWGDRWELATHIPDVKANRQGLENVARHLREGGLFLLNRQKPHENYEQKLPGGIIYSQSLEHGEDTKDYHVLQKSYFFKKDGEIVAVERLTLTYFKPEAYQQMLKEAGFDFQDANNDGCFTIYKKR